MEKGKFIEQLTPGSSFSQSLFVVANAEIKQGKTGNPYAMFNIEDRTGSTSAKFWNIPNETQKVLLNNTFFVMNGQVDTGQYSGQVSITTLKPVPESEINVDDFLAKAPDDHQFHLDRFIRLVNSVKQPHLKSLLRAIFGGPTGMFKRFKDAVAAKSMHHSHRGGLIEHSSEVAEMCDKICDVLPGLNRDLLVTCALLHDIGKLEEMEHGIKHGEYTEDGALIGHIVLGTQIILGGMGPEFPPVLKKLVLHLILSHHGKGEFGSPKDPSTPEAHVLAQCDLLSAKAFQTRQAIKNARPGQINIKAGDFWAYVGDYGIDVVEQSTPTIKEILLPFEADCARLPIKGTDEFREVSLPGAGADYLLKVKTNGMDTSGILPGDLVFVNESAESVDQSLVAVNFGGPNEEVRRLVIKAGEHLLESDNPLHPTVPVTDAAVITGRVTGLFREL